MKMVVNVFVMVAVVLLLGVPASYSAEAKIGTVDSSRVLLESKAGQEGMKAIETIFNDKQSQFDMRSQEIMEQKEELERQSALISAEQKKQRKDKLEKDIRALGRFKEDSEIDLNKKRDEMLEKMSKEVRGILESYGKQEGYTLILERSVVLYAPEAVDITDKIIESYDRSKGLK